MQPDVAGILEGVLKSIGAPYKDISRIEIAGQQIYMITAEDGKLLIGSHGDTIHAIDHLVKKIVEKQLPAGGAEEDGMHFLVDINEYRTRQIRDLQTKALMMAERARSFQYDVELSPMSAYERLIVHTTLQDAPNVKTESQGEGRNRRVVIKYAA
jgi:spoIIIJ-associated protein